MVDYESYFQYGGADGRNGPLMPSEVRWECACSDCVANKGLRERYRTCFDETKYAGAKEWDPEQYLLCPPRVLGYVLEQKEWAQLQVTHMNWLSSDDTTDAWHKRLKMPDDDKESKRRRGKSLPGSPAVCLRKRLGLTSLVRCSGDDKSNKGLLFDLVRSHTSATVTKSEEKEAYEALEVDDFVKGKGKGLIILLYGWFKIVLPQGCVCHLWLLTLLARHIIGPPGVGKTSTAETIAIATKKPLFSVSVAEVGTDAQYVEQNLSRIFTLAAKWQAILLLFVLPNATTSPDRAIPGSLIAAREANMYPATRQTYFWRVGDAATRFGPPTKTLWFPVRVPPVPLVA
jgi:hypothetical protein